MTHSPAAVITASMKDNKEISNKDLGLANDDDDDLPFAFPQPKPHQLSPLHHNTGSSSSSSINNPDLKVTLPYQYLRFDQIESACSEDLTIQEGSLCWVLLSQGKNRTSRLFKPARILQRQQQQQQHRNDVDVEDHVNNSSFSNSNKHDPRFLVQYPKGSTYWVRQSNLIPVLEHSSHFVIVTSETTDYRRTAIVHTTIQDHFIEIGCDFGILVDLVQAKSALGMDKSETSINVARTTYPTKEFLLKDIFLQEDDDQFTTATSRPIPYPDRKEPLVVAIDINGNRELPAVLKCIELVLTWSPRLIIVKSRALYAQMMKIERVGNGKIDGYYGSH
jgi:hypothetical protein